MAYEKYITKNGKVYGPYVYHSKRVNGKVVSEYRGQDESKVVKKRVVKKKPEKPFVRGKETFPPKRQVRREVGLTRPRLFAIIGMISFLLAVLGVFFFSGQLTGQSIVDFQGFVVSDELTGTIDLTLNGGELIPADSTILISNGNNSYEFLLSNLFIDETNIGKYYLTGVNLEGSGEGYGLLGEKREALGLSFEFEVKAIESSSGGSDSSDQGLDENVTEEQIQGENVTEEPVVNETVSEGTPVEENVSQGNESLEETPVEEVPVEEVVSEEAPVEEVVSEEVPVEEVVSEEAPVEEAPVEEEPVADITEAAPITGNIISNFFNSILTGRVIEGSEIISGEVSIDNEFTYNIPDGAEVSLVPGSVSYNGEILSDSVLEFSVSDGVLSVSTNYSNVTYGFGEEYLTAEEKTFKIDLGKNSIELVEGSLDVSLFFNESEITSFSTNILKDEMNESQNKTTEEIAEEIFEDKNITSEFVNLTLTEDEKNVLRTYFKLIVVNTTVVEYRDKILVDFKLGDYIMSNSYDSSLSESKIKELIDKDRVIWLKDLSRELSSVKYEVSSRDDLNSLYPVM